MHELSIVMSIVEIALQEAEKEKAQIIEEIELDIGCLSTIEMEAFEFAWRQGVKNTLLEKASKVVNRIEGKARCNDCETVFVIQNLYDACTKCGGHFLSIQQGNELRVKSLVVI